MKSPPLLQLLTPWLKLSLVWLLTGLVLGGEAWSQSRPLRVPAVTSWGMPFAMYRDGKLVGGINYDIVQAVADQLHLQTNYISYPRPRVDLAAVAGEFDLRCQISPEWVRSPEAYVWSSALFEMTDNLIGHDAIGAPRTLEQLPVGAAISTVLGFVYPQLEERFQDGRLKREDTVAVDRMLRKLSLRRTPYAVANQRDIAWYQRNTPDHNIASWRLPVARYDYRCAVPKASPVDAAELMGALERLKQQGLIEKILQRYALPQYVLAVSTRSNLNRLSRQEVIDLFLGQLRELPDGHTALLATVAGLAREEFYRSLLEKDAAQLKAIWSRQVFSGRAKAPKEFGDAEAARAWLLATPNALLLLPAEAVDASVRVVFSP
ncbi:transporter substrate-binding domain-containing protein [Paucibacter sp. APW11]|uniref:Transporter substrate-binding domain-containing protein n=1 Tax=Roseateles aquae TaxID=3077235 RepID=A0ABU3PAI6_9BURK|nr:transporter substrate-binding domain-containing protein [Paucibacter sp. APW11]MDT8999113.1 transporter substrate-binding domain-containing protein [Paucibacter sp. APW11]